MQLFGYAAEHMSVEQVVPLRLAEVTLLASPLELRTMAIFLSAAADEMNWMGDVYDHLHLCDAHKAFEASPHFVVVRGESEGNG